MLNSLMTITRAGGALGIPGLYVTGDPGRRHRGGQGGVAVDPHRPGLGEVAHLPTGQCPVMKYHRGLMEAILDDRCQIAKAVNAKVISLDDAPKGYEDFDKGAAEKYVLNPHGLIKA